GIECSPETAGAREIEPLELQGTGRLGSTGACGLTEAAQHRSFLYFGRRRDAEASCGAAGFEARVPDRDEGDRGRRGCFPQPQTRKLRVMGHEPCSDSGRPEGRQTQADWPGRRVARVKRSLLAIFILARAIWAQDGNFFATKVYPVLEEARCRLCHTT